MLRVQFGLAKTGPLTSDATPQIKTEIGRNAGGQSPEETQNPGLVTKGFVERR